ncbi:MAG: arsenate reductase ArsC [Gammaproteobacteria bacterium]|nr:arsenate reductase ArsC [Gammaproteobacteria bacterium]
MKKVLILCTGNSCRSIIAEALINAELGATIQAFSSGVDASATVHPSAKKILQIHDIWRDEYHSKKLETLTHIDFDLVVTVCDHASQTCPIFPNTTELVHLGFEDPDGSDYQAFELCFNQIKARLLPYVSNRLN